MVSFFVVTVATLDVLRNKSIMRHDSCFLRVVVGLISLWLDLLRDFVQDVIKYKMVLCTSTYKPFGNIVSNNGHNSI